MPAPPRITEWLRRTYPKPTVDPEWLDACLAWISEELHLDDVDAQAEEIISNVESQLLNSDLHDSMLAGTGLPRDIGTAENTLLRGHTLVQMQGITEIGHSAFSLQNVQQMRMDRADLAGLREEEEEEEGPIPKYPRSMLRFDLTDGSNSVRAIEFRKLPGLELGVTPLGFKMILKDVPIRQGIAFLEPSNVVLKGHMTEELDANRDTDFARGLRMRLGQPEPEPTNVETGAPNSANDDPPPSSAPANVDAQHPDENEPARVPLREVTVDEPRHLPRQPAREDLESPTRRRVPVASTSVLTSTASTIVSPYFSNTSASPSGLASVRLSPIRRDPLPARATNGTTVVEDSFDFSDDMLMDDAFLRELDVAEQAAMSAVQQRSRNIGQMGSAHPTREDLTAEAAHSEVIVIDSDEDDKENLAPVQRRVRRRIDILDPEHSNVIVID